MSASKSTPMMRQYLTIKEEFPDTLLFYRMGDFFELFFEDAKKASRLLEITLTSRDKNRKDPIPMCGVPAKAVQGYIGRLLDMGEKVALCDQVEDPAKARGLVKREVIRVVTPGMVVEDELLDAKSGNFICAVAENKKKIGAALLDISTGLFKAFETNDENALAEEVAKIDPAELILAEGFSIGPENGRANPLGQLGRFAITRLPDKAFGHAGAKDRLLDQFNTRSLKGFGLSGKKAAVSAAGALLFYVEQTQKTKMAHVKGIETYFLENHLLLDETAVRNLELLKNLHTQNQKGALISVLDQTVTPMGGRLLKEWIKYPLVEKDRIQNRQAAVDEAKKNLATRREVVQKLKTVADISRLAAKISMGHGNPRDMLGLQRSLAALPEIEEALKGFGSPYFALPLDIGDLVELSCLLGRALREDAPFTTGEGGIFKTGYHAELDDLIAASSQGKEYLARLQSRERQATGINSLKVRFNKVFGYYIEISKSQLSQAPEHYIRKQTLVNAERFVTEELKQHEEKVLGAEEKRAALEQRLFQELRLEVMGHNPDMMKTAGFLSKVDCVLSLAEVADVCGYARPEITDAGAIVIEDGRHPVVERMGNAERFVPNSICLDNDQNQVLIITGPNMAGKSTVLRQVALMVIMAQMGGFVPAKKAQISLTDRIFTRVGALDNLSQGQSTFMVEMEETANILNNATPQSLVILDEIGRGTSTFDGLSIAWAVAEFLHDLNKKGVKTLFATHYHELTELARHKARVKNFNIAVKEWNDEIIFLRKLVDGGTNKSYGIQVARLAGVPQKVVDRARHILSGIQDKAEISPGKWATEDDPRPKGPTQLALFRPKDRALLDRLKNLNTSVMTPVEALVLLDELKQEAEKIS